MTASPDRAGLLREAAQAFLDWYDSPGRSYQRDGTAQRVVAALRVALAATGDSEGPLDVEGLRAAWAVVDEAFGAALTLLRHDEEAPKAQEWLDGLAPRLARQQIRDILAARAATGDDR